eukprot:631127-Lingulodinium_polyedra.AAC.1
MAPRLPTALSVTAAGRRRRQYLTAPAARRPRARLRARGRGCQPAPRTPTLYHESALPLTQASRS